MTRGRKPRVCADDVWDHIKGIDTPLQDQLSAIIEKLQRIQLREKGLLEFEAALKGKIVKPCKTLGNRLDTLEASTEELDEVVVRCAKWMAKRRKARIGQRVQDQSL